ncbi:MAG: EVE domain-containing protein [Arthrobacter sp.]|nr:EVE domain-containing protein [Arthrobacter sp.]
MNTVSLDHVQAGVSGGFTQADHGAESRLRRLRPGDGIVFYSPRTSLRGGVPVQQFTAIAVVTGDQPYQVNMSEDFHPWRLAVRFARCRAVDAKSLVPLLSFIQDPTHWGLPFRRGLFAIPEADYRVIAAAMSQQSRE